jgi:glyoxylase-like metal-dependent hydrolase (beta-lactamase superfamily II)
MKMIKIALKVTNCYLFDTGSGYLQIDTGYEKDRALYLAQLKKNNITFKDISYILLTHAHDDHAGLIPYVVSENPGVHIIAHEKSKEILAQGCNDTSVPGFNPSLIINFLFKLMYKLDKTWTLTFPKYKMRDTDIIVNDASGVNEDILKNIGIKDGVIVSTPGHCKGHISVVIGKNKVIAGDAVSNMLTWAGSEYVPLYFEDIGQIYRDWGKLLDNSNDGVIFYPGHGLEISGEKLKSKIMALNLKEFPRQRLMPR